MPIVITDEDAARLLSIPEAIEAMRVAFRDLAEGKAINPPRLRYYDRHRRSDAALFRQHPCRRGADLPDRLRAGWLALHADGRKQRPPPHARQSRSGELVGHHPLRPEQRRAARLHARDASVGLPRRRHHRSGGRRMRASGRRGAGTVWHRQPGIPELSCHMFGAADQAGAGSSARTPTIARRSRSAW